MTALSLLRANPGFRWLWLARTFSFLGDGIALIALLLLVKETEDSGAAVAALLLAQGLPRVLGPVAGAIADRVDQRSLMIGCDLGQALIFTLVALLVPPLPVLLPMITATSILATAFGPAGRSAIPRLVPDPADLLGANALLAVAFNVRLAAGPLLGGALIAAAGVRGGLAVNAASFVLSALFLSALPPLAQDDRRPLRAGGLLLDTWRGLEYAFSHRVTRVIVISLLAGVTFASMDNVALVFFARDDLGVNAVGFGLLSSAFGLGMIAGSLGLLRRKLSALVAWVFLAGLVLTGLGNALTSVVSTLFLGIVAQAVAGIGNGISNVGTDTLVQQTVQKDALGRMFGVVSTASFLGGSLASILGGVLIEATSPRTVFLVSGLGTLSVAVLVLVAAPRWLFSSGPGRPAQPPGSDDERRSSEPRPTPG